MKRRIKQVKKEIKINYNPKLFYYSMAASIVNKFIIKTDLRTRLRKKRKYPLQIKKISWHQRKEGNTDLLTRFHHLLVVKLMRLYSFKSCSNQQMLCSSVPWGLDIRLYMLFITPYHKPYRKKKQLQFIFAKLHVCKLTPAFPKLPLDITQ